MSKIKDYELLINALKREIELTKNPEQKDILIHKYCDIICEFASIVKKDFSYYENKISSLNLNDTMKTHILKRIKHHLVPSNIYFKERELYNILVTDFENPNVPLIKVWIDNYIDFLNRYKNELRNAFSIDTIKEYILQLDKEKKYIAIVEEYIKTKLPHKEKYEILNKKSLKKQDEIANKLFGLASNKKYIPEELLTSILKKTAQRLNDEKKIEEDSSIKNDLEKSKTNYLRKLLMKEFDDGEFSKNYKKHRIRSMLLNMNLVEVKNKKNTKFTITNINKKNQDMYKGLGKC